MWNFLHYAMYWLGRCYNIFCPKEKFLVKWQVVQHKVVQIYCSSEQALVLKLCILFTSSSSDFAEVEAYIPALEKIPFKKNPFFLLLPCKYVKKCKLIQGRMLLLKKIWRPGISKSRGLCCKSQFIFAEFMSCCCMHSGFLLLLTYPNSLRAFLCQG